MATKLNIVDESRSPTKTILLLAWPVLIEQVFSTLVGYADTAHFSRVFKKLEGISAGEWRNIHCGKF